MNHCRKCGADFEGNFCPHCGTRVEENAMNACPRCGAARGEGTRFCANCGFSYEERGASAALKAVRRKATAGGAFVKAHKKPFVLGAVGLVLAVVLLIVMITNLSNIFRPSKVNNISIGDSEERVLKQLGDPNGDEGEFVWYGKAYTKLAKKIEEKENSLEFCDSEKEMEKLTEELDALYEEMDSLVYPYIEVTFDGDDKVSSVVYDAAYSEGGETPEKVVKKTKILSPGFIAYLQDPKAPEYTVETYYKDGSYRLDKLYAKDVGFAGDKERILTFRNKWGEFTAEIKVGSQIPEGTEVKGTFGEGGTYTLTALAAGDKVNLPLFSLKLAGTGTVGAVRDMPWAEFPLHDVTVEGNLKLGDRAFRGSAALETVTVGRGVPSIGSDAFYNCPKLTAVTIMDSSHKWVWDSVDQADISDATENARNLVSTRRSLSAMHEWSTTPRAHIVATCTEPGSNVYSCTLCGEEGEEMVPSEPALGHDWSLTDTTAATCTTAGMGTYDCTRCHETKQEATKALGHSGFNQTCTRCGEAIGSYIRCDKDNTPNASGKYILFGEYPQTLKADDVTITGTTDSRGYYLGSDGYYYAKITATPLDDGCKFSTGATVTRDTVYYFKVEPIRWRILTEGNGKAFLLCDSIIANHCYDEGTDYDYRTIDGETVYPNNYMYSSIRNWLNEEFYKAAFSALQQELIQVTTVDNSARSTNPNDNATEWDSGKNSCTCANTSDKIFLPSMQEVTNSAYGFSSDYSSDYGTARMMQTSDYVRATGAYMNTDDYYGNGWWWLRSPDYDNIYGARFVGGRGNADNDCVNRTFVGCVPALWISL